jgi:hypothetical protein
MIYFLDGIKLFYPFNIGDKVIIKEIGYEESLSWNKLIDKELEDPMELSFGDVVFNRVFDGEGIARWFIVRFQ